MKETRIDILVNNAGLFMPSKGFSTKQGFEGHFGINYLGHYLLSHLLYAKLVETGTHTQPSRIINVSSVFALWGGLDIDHQKSFGRSDWGLGLSPYQLYGQSKKSQVYHALEMARLAKERDENVISVSLHPGWINTDIDRANKGNILSNIIKCCVHLFGKTSKQGAQTILHCCLVDSTNLENGGFYYDSIIKKLPSDYNMDHQLRLKKLTDKMLGLY